MKVNTAPRRLPALVPLAPLLSPRLPDILARDFAALVPLVRWLNQAIGYSSRDRRF